MAGANTTSETKVDDTIWVFPEELILVTDPKHPLYQTRVHRPVNEKRIESILKWGVKQPVIARRNSAGRLEVKDGRGRTKDACEANRRRRARGMQPCKIRVVVDASGSSAPADLLEASLVCNSLRDEDDPITQAFEIQRYMSLPRHDGSKPTTEDAAHACGISTQTVIQRLKLLDLSPNVQNAVKTGELPIVHALGLHLYEHEEQEEKLARLLAAQLEVQGKMRQAQEGRYEPEETPRGGSGGTTTKPQQREQEPILPEKRRSPKLPTKTLNLTYNHLNALVKDPEQDRSSEHYSQAVLATTLLGWILGKLPEEEVSKYPAIASVLTTMSEKPRRGRKPGKKTPPKIVPNTTQTVTFADDDTDEPDLTETETDLTETEADEAEEGVEDSEDSLANVSEEEIGDSEGTITETNETEDDLVDDSGGSEEDSDSVDEEESEEIENDFEPSEEELSDIPEIDEDDEAAEETEEVEDYMRDFDGDW